jgi:SNF2 family DNA or RNA helicase
VFNWMAEARKFTPGLKVLALHGPDRRARFEEIAASDIVLTSYALIRRDAELYRGLEFDTVVLDEAQHIKNRQTQNAQAVKAVAARHRLVLTGTPMENSVLDLWSIFDFLMPGYLGTAPDFRERYELPITREKDAPPKRGWRGGCGPSCCGGSRRKWRRICRRNWNRCRFCELTAGQRGVYQQVIEASRKRGAGAAGAQEAAKSRMLVLDRAAAAAPGLLRFAPAQTGGRQAAGASGKLDLFGELLEEVLDGGHRALVFSQFVSMLTLVEGAAGRKCQIVCYLDGSTADRGAVVEQFQNDPPFRFFSSASKPAAWA